MDAALLGWGRAVKRRRRARLPVLWLFTDEARVPDPLPAIARLPPGLCGVVFRHDAAPGRAALGRRVAALCRAKRLPLVVAGDARLAAGLRAGIHLRAGTGRPRRGVVTASAHDGAELRRAARAGAVIIFLSPAFATASHPGSAGLGARRWAARARAWPNSYALGGVTGQTARALPRFCAGAGAIGALS